MSDGNKDKYFNMSDALDEFKHGSFGAKEKIFAGLKIFGKGLANSVIYTATEAVPAIVEQTHKTNLRNTEELLKRDDLALEQRGKLEENREKSKKYLNEKEEQRWQREIEAEEAPKAQETECAGRAQAAAAALVVRHEASAQEPTDAGHAPSTDIPDIGSLFSARFGNVEVDSNSNTKKPPCGSLNDQKSALTTPRLLDYIKCQVFITGKDQRVFVSTEIPKDKLENALKARLGRLRSEEILLLADDTVFGSAKDGILITNRSIGIKHTFQEPNHYDLTLQPLSPCEIKNFALIAKSDVQAIFRAIDLYFHDLLEMHQTLALCDEIESQFYLSRCNLIQFDKQRYWLECAARNGHPIAQHNLGVELLATDPEQACHWLELAASQGHSLALSRLEGLHNRSGGPNNLFK